MFFGDVNDFLKTSHGGAEGRRKIYIERESLVWGFCRNSRNVCLKILFGGLS